MQMAKDTSKFDHVIAITMISPQVSSQGKTKLLTPLQENQHYMSRCANVNERREKNMRDKNHLIKYTPGKSE